MSASTRSSVLGRNVSPAIPGRAVVPERRRLRLHFFFLQDGRGIPIIFAIGLSVLPLQGFADWVLLIAPCRKSNAQPGQLIIDHHAWWANAPVLPVVTE